MRPVEILNKPDAFFTGLATDFNDAMANLRLIIDNEDNTQNSYVLMTKDPQFVMKLVNFSRSHPRKAELVEITLKLLNAQTAWSLQPDKNSTVFLALLRDNQFDIFNAIIEKRLSPILLLKELVKPGLEGKDIFQSLIASMPESTRTLELVINRMVLLARTDDGKVQVTNFFKELDYDPMYLLLQQRNNASKVIASNLYNNFEYFIPQWYQESCLTLEQAWGIDKERSKVFKNSDYIQKGQQYNYVGTAFTVTTLEMIAKRRGVIQVGVDFLVQNPIALRAFIEESPDLAMRYFDRFSDDELKALLDADDAVNTKAASGMRGYFSKASPGLVDYLVMRFNDAVKNQQNPSSVKEKLLCLLDISSLNISYAAAGTKTTITFSLTKDLEPVINIANDENLSKASLQYNKAVLCPSHMLRRLLSVLPTDKVKRPLDSDNIFASLIDEIPRQPATARTLLEKQSFCLLYFAIKENIWEENVLIEMLQEKVDDKTVLEEIFSFDGNTLNNQTEKNGLLYLRNTILKKLLIDMDMTKSLNILENIDPTLVQEFLRPIEPTANLLTFKANHYDLAVRFFNIDPVFIRKKLPEFSKGLPEIKMARQQVNLGSSSSQAGPATMIEKPAEKPMPTSSISGAPVTSAAVAPPMPTQLEFLLNQVTKTGNDASKFFSQNLQLEQNEFEALLAPITERELLNFNHANRDLAWQFYQMNPEVIDRKFPQFSVEVKSFHVSAASLAPPPFEKPPEYSNLSPAPQTPSAPLDETAAWKAQLEQQQREIERQRLLLEQQKAFIEEQEREMETLRRKMALLRAQSTTEAFASSVTATSGASESAVAQPSRSFTQSPSTAAEASTVAHAKLPDTKEKEEEGEEEEEAGEKKKVQKEKGAQHKRGGQLPS